MLRHTGVLALGICAILGTMNEPLHSAELSARSQTRQLIIQLDDDNTRRIQSVGPQAVMPDIQLSDGRALNFKRRFQGNSIVVELPEAVTLEQAQQLSAELAAQPGIAAVQPDKRLYPALVPNDPEYPLTDPTDELGLGQWHLRELGVGINMEAAWDRETGDAGIVVAVLDTGIVPHRDLSAARVLPGYDFFSGGFSNIGSQLDNDPILGDPLGRDSNPVDPGDATVVNECGAGVPGEDSSWHGLSVSGVIVAESENNLDIAGIDFAARLLPVRVLGKCGGDLSDVADAIRWAAGLSVAGVPDNPTPANVINLSLSGAGACSPQEQAAIDAAVNVGAVVIAAAGNEGGSVDNVSPANCNNVITVGATARDGMIASYVNVGTLVDLAAPGGDDTTPTTPPDPPNPSNGVLTLWNTGTTTVGADTLAIIQGTSFTAAQASGVAALMLAVNPALSPSLLESVMKGSTQPFPDPSCTTTTCGTGLLDADAALAGAADPASVVGKTATTSGGGGGGCVMVQSARFDPLWLVLLSLAVFYRVRRRA